MTPEGRGVRDPSHPQGNTHVLLADTSRTLIGSGEIQGGEAGAGVEEGGRAGTGSGDEQGVGTREPQEVHREEGHKVGVHSEEDHGAEVGAGEEAGVMRSWISLAEAKISSTRKSSNLVTAKQLDQTINQ